MVGGKEPDVNRCELWTALYTEGATGGFWLPTDEWQFLVYSKNTYTHTYVHICTHTNETEHFGCCMENGHGRGSHWETTVSRWALMVALARVVGVGPPQ